MDARPRPRAAPSAGEGLAGADRSRAAVANGRRSTPTGTWPAVGPVKLSTVGAPTPQVSETTVKRAEAPRLLEYSWGGNDLRWELEPLGSGTRLTLWHNIDRRYISWGAAGWHICFDVLDRAPRRRADRTHGRARAMKFDGWQRLNAEYAKQFGVDDAQRGMTPRRTTQYEPTRRTPSACRIDCADRRADQGTRGLAREDAREGARAHPRRPTRRSSKSGSGWARPSGPTAASSAPERRTRASSR